MPVCQRRFKATLERDEAKDAEESEDAVIAAWKDECDRLRLEKGRCVVNIGDQPWEYDKDDPDHESKPDWSGYASHARAQPSVSHVPYLSYLCGWYQLAYDTYSPTYLK